LKTNIDFSDHHAHINIVLSRNRLTTYYRFPAVILLFITLILFSCHKKADRIGMPEMFTGAIPDTITIVSYNVENLFDMVDNGNEYDEFKPGRSNWTNNTFRKKLDNIALVVGAIRPDIAVLVEIENENAAKALCDALKEKKCAFPYYALGGQTNRVSTMPVVLSRFPVISEKRLALEETGSAHDRNMLEANIFLGSDTLTVFACHWPSKMHKESQRLANAELLARRLSEVPAGKDYIVAGDFNADYDECETFHTSDLDDTKGITGINHVLKTVTSKPLRFVVYTSKRNLISGMSPGLFDVWLDVPEPKRFSMMFKGRPQTPDHFLLPASMFDSSGISYADHSFGAFTWNGRLFKDGAPYRWQMRYSKQGKIHVGEGFSDHLPLVVKLCRGPYRPDSLDTGVKVGNEQRSGKAGLSGFEDGVNGWMACTKQVRVVRDTVNPYAGQYCLLLAGKAKDNACAARCRMAVPVDDGKAGSLCMALRGRGSICIRVKRVEEKKWTYFKGETFTPAKAGKYTAYSFGPWKTISLPLSVVSGSKSELEVEIRTKKGEEIKLFLDDVRIQ
jgi:endonuclease/exonuclease/phosphatase family metal-dependent hydrolase